MLEYAINMGIHLPVKQRDIAGMLHKRDAELQRYVVAAISILMLLLYTLII